VDTPGKVALRWHVVAVTVSWNLEQGVGKPVSVGAAVLPSQAKVLAHSDSKLMSRMLSVPQAHLSG
jgi:hypothetical protein